MFLYRLILKTRGFSCVTENHTQFSVWNIMDTTSIIRKIRKNLETWRVATRVHFMPWKMIYRIYGGFSSFRWFQKLANFWCDYWQSIQQSEHFSQDFASRKLNFIFDHNFKEKKQFNFLHDNQFFVFAEKLKSYDTLHRPDN